jgi:hypothetical protein
MMKIFAVILLAPLTAAAASLTSPLNIGIASASRGAVRASAPGAAGRVVETGKPVYSHDKVTTGPDGKLQILLLDQTSFTIGANSELELDEFVFDPATNAGKVSAKIVKGAFRFVTGKVARRDPSSMRVDTPVGTIGIRGTMTAGTVSADQATIVLLGPGPENNADEKSGGITVKNDKGSTEIDKDGWGVTIKAGEAPSKPFELSPGQLDGILNGVGSAPKGDSKDDSAGGGSTDKSSGQDTAKGKNNAGDAFAALDASQSETSLFASQQFGAPTTPTWADVIAIPSGTGRYAGTGNFFNCTGGSCSSTPSGTFSFGINVDFGAKTLGGGTSFINMAAPGINGTFSSAQSYGSLSGDAKINIGGSISAAGGNFTGTELKLLNSGGVTAAAATLDLKAFNTSNSQTYGGTATGTR